MYINKPSRIKIEAADGLTNLCIILAAGLNSTNLENLVKYYYPCPDVCHVMIVTKKALAFRHRN